MSGTGKTPLPDRLAARQPDPMSARQPNRLAARLSAGLGLRLGLMVMLALLPLGVLSLGQTRNLLQQSDDARILAAMGETVQASLPEVLMIRDAQSVAAGLALAVGQTAGDPATCLRLVRAAAAADPALSLVAFMTPSGVMNCASTALGRDFSASPSFQRLIAARSPQMEIVAKGSVSGESLLLMIHPVFGPDGGHLGFVSVSVPHRALDTAHTPPAGAGLQALVALTTFDAAGGVLTSTLGLDDAASALPATQPLTALARDENQSFFGPTAEGRRQLYTVVPIADGLYLLGTWRVEGRRGLLASPGFPYLFPLLMWLAGLGVALFGAERLVLRHLRRLSRAMRGFAFGSRSAAPQLVLDDPPAEIASLADTYRTLIDTILRDEAELENLLRQKAELLREVHHRTGNSLQLIGSILRMHRRETEDPAMLQLIDTLHDRVISLSTVHLGLYRIAGRADVAVDALLAEVIAKVGAIQGRQGRRDAIRAEMVPLMLTAQQAVPLALLVAEMLSVFPPDGEGPGLTLRLTRAEGNLAELALTGPAEALATLGGTGEGAARAGTARGMGSIGAGSIGAPGVIATRLIRSFVAQLDGDLTVTAAGPLAEARVRFVIRLAAPEAAQDMPAAAAV